MCLARLHSKEEVMRQIIAALALLFLASCARSGAAPAVVEQPSAAQDAPRAQREIRITGIVEAIHTSKVIVPQIVGQNGRLTLTRLIGNGSQVKAGDVIAEFDPTQQLDAAFIARARYEDLGHQVDQKTSQNRADAEKRRSDLTQAEADLRKAQLEVEKAP